MSSSIIEEYSFKAMGGNFLLRCYPQNSLSRQEVRKLFAQAELEVLRIENELTDFRASPFNEINEQAGIAPVQVSQEIFDIIHKAITFSKKTNGKFDISYASVGHLWRQARRKGIIPSDEMINNARKLVNFKNIKMDYDNKTVYLPKKEMRIGLGGIGKGYAVDQIYQYLKSEGLVNFYINGSGDVRVHSHHQAPRPWKIGIRNPFAKDPNKTMGMVQLKDGAIATSGDYINFILNEEGEKKLHHIINPLTGRPSEGVVSATVMADSTIEADTIATILMLSAPKEAMNYLNEYNLNGFVLTSEGKTLLSKRSLANFQQV